MIWFLFHIDPSDPALSNDSEARRMAKDAPDFKNELSEIKTTMSSISVEVAVTPKGYC